MLLKVIDKLLDRSFGKEPDYKCLNRLESDVWRQVRQSRDAARGISVMLPVWPNVQLRYASLVLVVISGLAVSQISFYSMPKPDRLGLQVFSPRVSFL
ncbi:MAG: hypothetical protein COB14_04280 [Alphaproteobacteria bacterium]|nr:MAG: hypothetical protein COB14_04280 [Alphaproteobacteria bacterium]